MGSTDGNRDPGPTQGRPQAVAAPISRSAIFLTLGLREGTEAREAVLRLCPDLSGLVRAVGFREPEDGLSCVMGFGSEAWDRLFGPPRPAELHAFREFRAEGRHALATPGDLFFHLRSNRPDLAFELATQLMERLKGSGVPLDEVHGFRYFDQRDLLGFVDGTENPEGQEAADAVLVGPEDPRFEGGSYVLVQRYEHDLAAWNALPTEDQERIIGRTKWTDVELADAAKPSFAHTALTQIVEDGEEIKVLRDNMPFGEPSRGVFGTYFLGYSRSPRTLERMLERMFVGDPPGNYDRLLDYSRPRTGNLFFAPSASFLEDPPT